MHKKYIKHCFKLAKLGETLAFPNPIVGCVIVHHEKIIGEGFHRACGEAHAEVNAIKNCKQKLKHQGYQDEEITEILKNSKIYINLEPCAHHGKTPPCTDLIVQHSFKELIFSSYDPNPKVSGQGLTKIKEAGVRVIGPEDLDPEIERESDYLNRIFFKTIKTPNLAWFCLKIALTHDGRMVTKKDEPRWISNVESRKDVHRLRSCHDLIITGAETIRQDDSSLNIRHSKEELGLADVKNPDIAILYRKNKIEDGSLYKVFTLDSTEADLSRKVFQTNNLEEVLKQGYKRILIETGPTLSKYFLEQSLVNEVIIYQRKGERNPNQQWQEELLNYGFQIRDHEVIKSKNESTDIKESWILNRKCNGNV